MAPRRRIAVISPFLDKQHGTERCVIEQLNRLSNDYEIHVYSKRVEDIDPGRIVWHRVRDIPGPHVLRYIWFVVANHFCRWWDRRFRNLHFDLVFSPGVNCFDADVIVAHIITRVFLQDIQHSLRFRNTPLRSWLRLLHRRLFYRIVIALEKFSYARQNLYLVVLTGIMARDVQRIYGKAQLVFPVYNAVDSQQYSPLVRNSLRPEARRSLGLRDDEFLILLIGNDLVTKGLRCLLKAVDLLQNPSIRVVVAGKDDSGPYDKFVREHALTSRLAFLPVRSDVEFYYAAADLYVGPSLYDGFPLPPLEAMACGVPAIVSSHAGISEIVRDGEANLVLADPEDFTSLAKMIHRFVADPALCAREGAEATRRVAQYTWDRNAAEIKEVLEAFLASRQQTGERETAGR
ncbi:MAG: glycosyltransferase family 4 protein [Candidatus Acidiferrales bacterium]